MYERCREIGTLILKYRNQFLGMLPEVERRKLYRKYGMHSVYEFAARLAGVSRETVEEVLRVNEHLKETPKLQEKLQSGEVGWSKLQVVSSLVRPENEDMWLEKVVMMPKSALQTYVHELKLQKVNSEAEFPAGWENKAENSSTVSDRETLSFSVSRRTAARIRVFQQQLEKKFRRPLTLGEVMEEFLKLAEAQKKPVSARVPGKSSQKSECVTRHIPAEIRRKIQEKYKGVCGFPNCNKPADIWHHTERFSLRREHNPDTIVPLCEPHERIAHTSLIAHEDQAPEFWKVLMEPDMEHPKYEIDRVVQKYRMPATMVA